MVSSGRRLWITEACCVSITYRPARTMHVSFTNSLYCVPGNVFCTACCRSYLILSAAFILRGDFPEGRYGFIHPLCIAHFVTSIDEWILDWCATHAFTLYRSGYYYFPLRLWMGAAGPQHCYMPMYYRSYYVPVGTAFLASHTRCTVLPHELKGTTVTREAVGPIVMQPTQPPG